MLDQFHPCMQDFIQNIVDVKADGITSSLFLFLSNKAWCFSLSEVNHQEIVLFIALYVLVMFMEIILFKYSNEPFR